MKVLNELYTVSIPLFVAVNPFFTCRHFLMDEHHTDSDSVVLFQCLCWLKELIDLNCKEKLYTSSECCCKEGIFDFFPLGI